ncbi:MAG: hypothetical protein RL736_355 [Pseudomonadota bacterium]|jgi:hypothetical protein
MNSFLIKTEYLATGQSLPFTGSWVNTALSRNALIVAYVSGNTATINLQGKSLLSPYDASFAQGGVNDNYTFYTTTGVTGYMSPAFLDSPITSIRLATPTTGAGKIWAYINYQN